MRPTFGTPEESRTAQTKARASPYRNKADIRMPEDPTRSRPGSSSASRRNKADAQDAGGLSLSPRRTRLRRCRNKADVLF